MNDLQRWAFRVALGSAAIIGSAAYEWSFRSGPFAALARPIAIAAGVSWAVFGGVLLAVTRSRPSVLAWADACLVTMGAGIGVLAVSVLANLAGASSAVLHGCVLLASNGLMCLTFAQVALSSGLSRRTAVLLWIAVLDGVFAVLLAVMIR